MDKEFIQSVIMLSDFKYYCDKAFKQQRILNNHQREHSAKSVVIVFILEETLMKSLIREKIAL